MTATVATIAPRGRPRLSIDVRGEDDLRSPGVRKTPRNGDVVMAMDFETTEEDDTSSTTTYEYDDEEENDDNINDTTNKNNNDVDALALEADAEPTEEKEEEEEDSVVGASQSSGDISIDTEIEMIKTESGSSSSASSNTVENTATTTAADLASPLANFITQTDASGKASTPRNAPMNSSPTQAMTVTPAVDNHEEQLSSGEDQDIAMTDVACETIITAFGRMCCCSDPALTSDETAAGSDTILSSASSSHKGGMTTRGRVANEDIVVDVGDGKNKDCCISSAKVATPSTVATSSTTPATAHSNHPIGYSTRGHDAPPLLEGDSALYSNPNNIKLLPSMDSVLDAGKKCLVLDLDETLVHSSFRAVKGADFVLPVQVRFNCFFSSSLLF